MTNTVVKRICGIVFVFLLIGGFLFAQEQENEDQPVGEPNPNAIGVDSAQQNLQEISVNKFEDTGFWNVYMASDQGVTAMRRFPGGPMDKEPIEGEEAAGIEEQDENVLGLKVEYFFRGHKNIVITPARPLPIEGICKTISVWVVGRNFNHELSIIVSDYFGKVTYLRMGKLNFSGWKKLTVAIPPRIKQNDYHYNSKNGVKFLGFRIETDPAESYGQYYLYLDDLRAVTDLFPEQSRDEDDMIDSW